MSSLSKYLVKSNFLEKDGKSFKIKTVKPTGIVIETESANGTEIQLTIPWTEIQGK